MCQIPVLLLISIVTLEKLYDIPVPQFPHF